MLQINSKFITSQALLTFALSVILIGASWSAENKAGPAGGADATQMQMLSPGFAVRALPIDLPAINVVRYRPDGKLVALGYAGKVYLLSDTDSDGLEDHVEVFYDPGNQSLSLGMALTLPSAAISTFPNSWGVYIARKGSVVLVLDTDGDERSDQEIILASNWETPKRFPGGASDAIGVAVGPDGSVYFGLGAANSQNGYLLENGVASYNIASERGTIMVIPPDHSNRSVVATGIRASVGLAFNATGDLFCTDQEGATWMPNGNPFDELLHIQTNRHYGFPPRHPVHLPKAIDEPSVFDYGPQHESTCGLQFNEPIYKGPVFGPNWWQGNALIAGESRGKIHRTELVKTDVGYVARDQILARSSWLTIDQCVSPKGELVIATHSGPPDWGNGPNAIGRLFKIVFAAPNTPQVALSYAASPSEICVAFDRPVEESTVSQWKQKIRLEEGWFVKEGDEFESFRPGYRAVDMQMATPRHPIPVVNTRFSDDRCELWITIPERTAALNRSVTLQDWPNPRQTLVGELPQQSVIATAVSLNGVLGAWKSSDGQQQWNGWLPHFDLHIAKELTKGSANHAKLWGLLETKGDLRLEGQLDLWSMLRPVVQPGERLDYVLPPERVTVSVHSSVNAKLTSIGNQSSTQIESTDGESRLITTTVKPSQWIPIEIDLPTGPSAELNVRCSTTEDNRLRSLSPSRIFLPWAKPTKEPFTIPNPKELAKGDRARGEQLFKTNCAVCHAIDDQLYGVAGPNLANLVYRDYKSVRKDIVDPNATINPDYVSFVIQTDSDQILTGVVIEDREQEIKIVSANGQPTIVDKSNIDEMKASPVSLMPTGLDKVLGEDGLIDLMTFLMIPIQVEH